MANLLKISKLNKNLTNYYHKQNFVKYRIYNYFTDYQTHTTIKFVLYLPNNKVVSEILRPIAKEYSCKKH